MLATSKSHRTSRDLDMVRIGAGFARVNAEVSRKQRNDVSVELIISRGEEKIVKVDGVKHPRIGELVGELNAVIFSTADIDMVKGEPERRRRFLNLEIAQVSPQYVYVFGRYKRILEQRNKLLKEISTGQRRASELDMWDTQLVEYGSALIARRAEFVSSIAEEAGRVYSSLTNGEETLLVAYDASVEGENADSEQGMKSAFAEQLIARRDIDITRGTTTVGPHRDDVDITINGLSARSFGSQGQQRTAAIALKLSEIGIMEQRIGEAPVVLLDDVLAELDESRRGQVLELTAGRCQTLLTTAHAEEVRSELRESADSFLVNAGSVVKQ